MNLGSAFATLDLNNSALNYATGTRNSPRIHVRNHSMIGRAGKSPSGRQPEKSKSNLAVTTDVLKGEVEKLKAFLETSEKDRQRIEELELLLAEVLRLWNWNACVSLLCTHSHAAILQPSRIALYLGHHIVLGTLRLVARSKPSTVRMRS